MVLSGFDGEFGGFCGLFSVVLCGLLCGLGFLGLIYLVFDFVGLAQYRLLDWWVVAYRLCLRICGFWVGWFG